jgi:hypothetical protein
MYLSVVFTPIDRYPAETGPDRSVSKQQWITRIIAHDHQKHPGVRGGKVVVYIKFRSIGRQQQEEQEEQEEEPQDQEELEEQEEQEVHEAHEAHE